MKRFAAMALLAALPASAHKASDSYLSMSVDGPTIATRWDIALRDADGPMSLDVDGDGSITWGELRARKADLARWALQHLSVSADGRACEAGTVDLQVDRHSDGTYAVLLFPLRCASAPETLTVSYRLLFDRDALHRGLLSLRARGVTTTAVFAPQSSTQRFALAGASAVGQMAAFVREGITHIWSGFDHVLFLLALLLPAVLRRENRAWVPVRSFQPALADAAKVVTAFTVAHSITLSASALGYLRLPSRLIESGIALSVAVAAIDNLYPIFHGRRWHVAFAFGLLHGFGFSSVLVDLGLPRAGLVRALFSFNIGVELGQLVIVALFLCGAYLLRRLRAYQPIVVQAGSVAIAAIAAIWFIERALGVRLFPGA